jgi:four helix bundle protein
MENGQERPTTFFRFEDLRIYHKSLEYISWGYDMAKNGGSEPYIKTFFDRFLISAQAISLNIAEGSSRNKSQFVYYLKMAKSSVRECVVLTTLALHRNIITQKQYDESKNQLMEMTKMIGALIGSLQRSVKTGDHGNDEDETD